MLEIVAIRPIRRDTGQITQGRRRQQAHVLNPRTGAFRLHDVPDARIAGCQSDSAVHAIPSTSIIE